MSARLKIAILKIAILSLLFIGGTTAIWLVYRPSPTDNVSNITLTPASATVMADGKMVYQEFCAPCHGINGEGQAPDAPFDRDENGLFPAPPHNETGHTWHHADTLIFEIIRDGGKGDPNLFQEMPAFGEQLTETQIKAVMAYIKTLWTDDQRVRQAETTTLVNEQNAEMNMP